MKQRIFIVAKQNTDIWELLRYIDSDNFYYDQEAAQNVLEEKKKYRLTNYRIYEMVIKATELE